MNTDGPTESPAMTLATQWAKTGVTEADVGEWTAGTLHASSRTQLLTDDTMLATDAEEVEALPTSPEQLTMGEAIGRGGMGLVRLARQASLRREVAVKTVHEPTDARSRNALLKEAWVGGALEHPNIVPVHTLATDDGGPAMVMKRVEGKSFLEHLEQPESGEAELERHLRVIIAVCHAIAFAHERGILHLDLKPENVMLGEFGEVYVVDWGLAVGFGEAAPSWIQPARLISGVAGTPGYMAPELVAADGENVGPRTDVYLIGGMLYTVLTGEPLHSGANLMQLLVNAWTSEPKPLPGVPEELAGVVRCATARERDSRFPTVDALREALEDFLRHRLADRLAGVAKTLHDDLRDRVGGEVQLSDVEAEPQLAELEQAILQARAEWPEHPKLNGLAEGLLELRAAHALSHRRADAAEIFLSRMKKRPARRDRELERLRAELEASQNRLGQLETIGRELDFKLGGSARRWLFGVSSVIWLGISLTLGWATRSGLYRVGYPELLLEGLAITLALVPLGWLGRRRFFQNRVNRRLYGGLLLTVLTVQAHWLACATMRIPVMTSVAITAIYYSYAFGTLAFVVDRRLVGSAIAMGLTAVAALFEPAWSYDLLGVGGFVACIWTLWMWRRGDGAERPA